jgi:16S rRNA (uracil1498-N3)-methyltransferase
MRVPRIYQDCTLSVQTSIKLNETATKHLLHVLRFDAGREVILFNGLGGEFRAKLSQVSRHTAYADILEKLDVNRESDIDIHLAQCVSKGDRFEFAIQKSVELGVKEITPVFSTRSQLKLNNERKEKKFHHWHQISISACEQSGRTGIVKINEPLMFAEFLNTQNTNSARKIILHPEGNHKLSKLPLCGYYTLLIGPEGGFENQELELAKLKGFDAVQLGVQVLRTETAPIAAISAIYALNKIY